MTSEALQNPYFVRLFCILLIVKNRSFDKMGIKVSKRGGDHFEKGGGDRPLLPPPKSALVCGARSKFPLVWFIYHML